MSQGGSAWEPFGQAGQLSLISGTPSLSKSQVLPTQVESLAFVINAPPKLAKLPFQA